MIGTGGITLDMLLFLVKPFNAASDLVMPRAGIDMFEMKSSLGDLVPLPQVYYQVADK